MTGKCPKCGKGISGKISSETKETIKELKKRGVNYDFAISTPRICHNCSNDDNVEVGMVPRVVARYGMCGEVAFYLEHVCHRCGTRYGDYYEEVGIVDEPRVGETLPVEDEAEWRKRMREVPFSAGREIGIS